MPSDGQAVRDHARHRHQPGQQDRLVADRAGRLRRPDAAVQRRLPGRRGHPAAGSTRPRRAATATSAPGGRSWRTTRSPRSWAGSATTPARPPATAAARRGGRDQLGRALPRRRGDRARLVARADRCRKRQAGARGRRRTLRALGRLPPRAARSRRDDPGGRPDGRRHDALRNPPLPPAREVLDAEVAADPRPRGRARAGQQGHRPARRRWRRAASTPSSWRSAPQLGQARLHPGRARRQVLDAVELLHCDGGRASRRCWAGGWPSTAAATPRWTPPGPPSGWARRGGRRLPARPRPDARARVRGRGGGGGGSA